MKSFPVVIGKAELMSLVEEVVPFEDADGRKWGEPDKLGAALRNKKKMVKEEDSAQNL